jgi:hypothetical protein
MATATSGLQFLITVGEPGLPAHKTACWYYAGAGDNPLIPETLTDHPYAEFVSIRFYWPVATRSKEPARALEEEVRAVTRAFIAAVEADRTLNGHCEVATITDADAGWLNTDNAIWRTVTIPLVIGFTDDEPIAR